MKFNFKIQQYQTDAVESVVRCFKGQPYVDFVSYRRDIGNINQTKEISQIDMKFDDDQIAVGLTDDFDDTGFKNENMLITSDQILSNINEVQQNNNVMISDALVDSMGACSLDVEMETGTGKTYVYIKTMFELNKCYGWSKFIVVVPSIAIREGVKKSFEITQDHFMEQYGKKARFFVYNSSNLNRLDAFSSNAGINVMIINMQAFNTSLKEDGRSKEARIIYGKRDEFNTRRPIDIIKANHPIIILDEPQKMGGTATQNALKNFEPLFTLNYSATHVKHHNLVYALDAVDAYNQHLVKKIEVKGFQVKNFRGTDHYLYLEEIIISPKHAPRARIEYEKDYKTKGINHESRMFDVGDNLYEISNSMEQYKGYRVKNDYVTMDGNDNITDQYYSDLQNNHLAPLPEPLAAYTEGIHKLIQSVFNEKILDDMIDNGNESEVQDNDLNDNFYKNEFQTLWEYINHKYSYTVSFDSKELIKKSIEAIDAELYVSMLQYTTAISEQKDTLSAEGIKAGDSFKGVKSNTTTLKHFETGQVKYDLIGKVAEATVLTRRTVAAILRGIRKDKFDMYQNNPEEFIVKVTRFIKEQKAMLIVDNISYVQLEDKYDSGIFTAQKRTAINKAFRAEKHIQPYVFTDGNAAKSVERQFAEALDGAAEVCAYAKLPKTYVIPTPVGNYSPDWAIAFKEGTVKHVFVVAETKGTMESLQLRPIEQAKIMCARKLFNEISTDNVVYHDVDSYQSLLNILYLQ